MTTQMAINENIAQVFENYGFYNKNELASQDVIDNKSVVVFKYSWKIQFPGAAPTIPENIVSPEFPKRTNSGITWHLATTYSKNKVDVKLSLALCNVQNINANCSFMLRSPQGRNLTNWVDALNKVFKLNDPLDVSNFTHLYSNNNSIVTNGFTIVCEITVPAFEVYPAQNQIISENQKSSSFQFTKKLLAMFDNEEFCDVTLLANEKELKAHKAILAAGSSVFQVMFEHDMMEKKHNLVKITDVDFEVLRELVRYIYTNEVSDLKKIAKELLVASDKYDLEKLKIMCENMLCKNISTDNVADMFIFADTYNAVFLRDEAKEYIVSHSNDVSDTPGWQVMITTHPHLIAEAFSALSKKHLCL